MAKKTQKAWLLVASYSAKNWTKDNCINSYKRYKKRNGNYKDEWSVQANYTTGVIKNKDRVFLIKVGRPLRDEEKGIVASGNVAREVYKNRGKNYIDIEFKNFHNPDDEQSILSLPKLEKMNHGLTQKNSQIWTSQNSGITIKESVINKLEKAWEKKVKEEKRREEELKQ